jgi:hypothetical protein
MEQWAVGVGRQKYGLTNLSKCLFYWTAILTGQVTSSPGNLGIADEVLTIFILTFGWRTTWRDFDSFASGDRRARVQPWNWVRNCDHVETFHEKNIENTKDAEIARSLAFCMPTFGGNFCLHLQENSAICYRINSSTPIGPKLYVRCIW